MYSNNNMIYLHIGAGEFKKTFQTTQVSPTIASIANYVRTEIAQQSVFEDLLLKTVIDQGRPAACWDLQWLAQIRGDRTPSKNGHHSKKAKTIESDTMLQNIAKQHESIHLQVVFDETKFEEWERQQKQEREIPMAKIVGSKEDSKYLIIEIDYPKKVVYQACYKVYETPTETRSGKKNEWNEIEDENNEILLSNLWQFKDYTIEIAMKNKYSDIYGKSECQSGFKITSHKIMFDGDSDGVRLDGAQEFERVDHKGLHIWCKTQLKSHELFDDLRQMKHGKIATQWILSMIEGFDNLNGNVFLWKDVSSQHIIHNLLKVSKGKKYQEKMKTGENKDAFSIHLCISVLSRLRILAFKQETKLGFIPTNNYVIHFWCFFSVRPVSDVYIRCCEVVSSLASSVSCFAFRFVLFFVLFSLVCLWFVYALQK